MPEPLYPFDPTGSALTNKIVEEQHTTTEANYRNYRFIVPNYAPFYTTNLVVKLSTIVNGSLQTVTLTEGVDYYTALPYMAAAISIGMPIYGAITLNNTLAVGIVSVTYQTLGGTWCVDQNYVYEWLAEKAYNPRLTLWDNVTNVQQIFPPINHSQNFNEFYSEYDLIQAINDLPAELADQHNLLNIVRHLIRTDNPHNITLAQLGLLFDIADLNAILPNALVFNSVDSTW